MRAYETLPDIRPALVNVLEQLLRAGVPPHHLARDFLAAVAHDYGHTGGSDRMTVISSSNLASSVSGGAGPRPDMTTPKIDGPEPS